MNSNSNSKDKDNWLELAIIRFQSFNCTLDTHSFFPFSKCNKQENTHLHIKHDDASVCFAYETEKQRIRIYYYWIIVIEVHVYRIRLQLKFNRTCSHSHAYTHQYYAGLDRNQPNKTTNFFILFAVRTTHFFIVIIVVVVVVYHSQSEDYCFFRRFWAYMCMSLCECVRAWPPDNCNYRFRALERKKDVVRHALPIKCVCVYTHYTIFYGVHISFELVLEFIYFIYSITNYIVYCAVCINFVSAFICFVLVFMVCALLEK